MKNGNLGFGLMRLPQRSAELTDIDTEQLNKMVDAFLQAGFTYFDTSWAYHNGGSESAIRECLVERYPRGTPGRRSDWPPSCPPLPSPKNRR